MKIINGVVFVLICVLIAGCSVRHDYVWHEYPIAKERIVTGNFSQGQGINIIKGKSDTSELMLGAIGPHNYFGNMQILTDGLAEQLAMEMEIRGLKIDETAGKSLEVAVQNANFERGMWKVAVTMVYVVKFGNGKTKAYTTRNSSPTTVDNTYNGAVALAVIDILNDPEVISYINGN